MTWINLKPENSGGGRKRQPPAAKLSASGQFVLNHEAADLLGNPEKVNVQVDPETSRFRPSPAIPGRGWDYVDENEFINIIPQP